MYSYKIQIKHKLTQADMKNRVIMSEWFSDKIGIDLDFLSHMRFLDETHLIIAGHVNPKNKIFWSSFFVRLPAKITSYS